MRFAEFRNAVQAHYGEEAAAVRHELYFLARRGRVAIWRAGLAALRDAWLCLRLPRHAPPTVAWVALATLSGANGWGALAPCIAELAGRGITCTVMIHPRLRGRVDGYRPARPALSAWRHALDAWRLRPSADAAPFVAPWLVRCCVFRLRLWRGAWMRTLPRDGAATLLLHNDFDLYAVAAQQAVGCGWRTLCVQHGLPTDEFFPVRAQRHLLWGPSSAEVYARHGVVAEAIGYGPARMPAGAVDTADTDTIPTALYLVSQTHTPIYGIDLAARFLALAQALWDMPPMGAALHILLHPEEVAGGHPYAGSRLAARCQAPPHRLLQAGAPPAIVVGFCSTALLQAASLGHYVIGLAWPAAASLDAMAVGRPAHQVADAPALGALITQLRRSDSARAAFRQRQRDWLRHTFVSDPHWPQRLGSAA